MATALHKDLKPMFGLKTEKHGPDNLEGFLTAVIKTLIKENFRCQRFERPNKKTREIYKVLQKLTKSGSVCVLTEKTNSARVIKIKDYKRWVSDHLLKAADLAFRPKVIALFEDVDKLLEKFNIELSVQEENFVRQSLATRVILSPTILIKDHKKIN